MKRFFKALAVLFTFLFLWAVILQWNDPDSYIWYALYGIPAVVSVLFLLNRLSHKAPFLLSLGYLVGAVFAWPAKFEGFTIGKGDIVNIEEGREACGLLIVAGIMLMYALRIRYQKGSKF